MKESTDIAEPEITEFTKWKNEPSLKDLKQNLTDAQSDHDSHITDVTRWLSNMHITGSAKVKTATGNSSVAPKIIRKQAEWRYSSLAEPFLSTPDIFNVRPITAGDRKRAKQNELVLNNQFNTKLDKTKFIDGYVREAVDIGTVIIKTGWETLEEEVTREKPTYTFTVEPTGQAAQYYQTLLQMQQQDPEGYADLSNPGLDQAIEMFTAEGIAYLAQESGTEEVTEIIETKNQPTLEILDADNVIIDPSCNGDIEKANFVINKFKTSLAILRADKKYKNLDSINVEAASPLASSDYEENKDNTSFNFTDEARKQFVVHEYYGTWDIDGDGITKQIVCAWVNDTIIRLELNPYPDRRPPFVVAVYMPVRRSIFGEPDGELLEDNQKIIGAVTRGMIDLLGKSANGQTGIRKDLLDVTNQRKFKRGDDYEFNATVDPRQAIYTHTYPEIPQSAYNMINMQNADAESLTGVKAFSSGISGASLGTTAANGRSALDAASKRELGILRRLATGIIQIGRKFISMNAEFLSDEEVIRITDTEFVAVRRDDLAGTFDLQLSISTAEEDNQKAEELAFMLQTTGPNDDPAIRRMIQADIARLRKMPDLAKKLEEYEPKPDPMAMKKAELEIALLEAQIAKEQSLTVKHNATAALDGQKVAKEQTQAQLNMSRSAAEQAKARNLSSKSDSQDLDYIEQESGVHQERELQKLDKIHGHKMDQQIHGKNADMASKLVEAHLSPAKGEAKP